MRTLQLKAFRVAPKLVLEPIIQYFGHKSVKNLKGYIVLGSRQLNDILKRETTEKKAFLFDFGSVVFLNLDSDEIRTFLEFLQQLAGNVDYSMFAKYHEKHAMKLYRDGTTNLWRDSDSRVKYDITVLTMLAGVLAKSTALEKIESDLDILLDKAEIFISKLEAGRLKANSRSFSSIYANLLRYEYEIAAGIKIYDRPHCPDCDKAKADIYDTLSDYYELPARLEVMERKAGELRDIVKSYSNISYGRHERRLIVFEVFLLSLFPLSYLADTFVEAFKRLMNWIQ